MSFEAEYRCREKSEKCASNKKLTKENLMFLTVVLSCFLAILAGLTPTYYPLMAFYFTLTAISCLDFRLTGDNSAFQNPVTYSIAAFSMLAALSNLALTVAAALLT